MLCESGSTLVWLYIDFPACSPSPIILSPSFKYLNSEVKLLIPLFRCPVLFSATVKCGCSRRIELLQKRQLQECLFKTEVRLGWEGDQRTRTWLQPVLWVLVAQCFPQRPAVFAALFRYSFYKPVLLLPPH